MIAEIVSVGEQITLELVLFAAVGFLMIGLSDVLIDLVWIGRTLWRRATVYRRYVRANTTTLAAPHYPG